jgi:hypothetical protein
MNTVELYINKTAITLNIANLKQLALFRSLLPSQIQYLMCVKRRETQSFSTIYSSREEASGDESSLMVQFGTEAFINIGSRSSH